VFERFTDGARRAIVLAQEEARLLNHNYIGTEHILLGLLHEEQGIAAVALTTAGVTREAVRDQVAQIIGRGDSSPSGHIPFTPRAKKVLELGLREALELGHGYIGTEHILLGLLREGEGVAVQVLVVLGASPPILRESTLALATGGEVPASARRPPPAMPLVSIKVDGRRVVVEIEDDRDELAAIVSDALAANDIEVLRSDTPNATVLRSIASSVRLIIADLRRREGTQ
jgi:ATP-dependent Clp protease ATP-binding subunit ClpC